ncbi:MAG: ribosomal protein S18-alanine N-acetyltransferase [Anaerolineales bacterium]|jgi:ribosomal-protein-alanine N-acetyltransferase
MGESLIRIRKMELDDIPAVLKIDHQSFPVPWSERTYRLELTGNPSAYFFVAEMRNPEPLKIVGYLGYWLIVDEAHISTFAVAGRLRRRGIGTKLLETGLRSAASKGAERVSLEVRVSNAGAIAMYEKIGFERHSIKPEYYRDNGEDALVMILYDVVKWTQGVREV